MPLSRKKIIRFSAAACIIAAYLFFFIRNNFKNDKEKTATADSLIYVFPDLKGPIKTSTVAAEMPASWRKYGTPDRGGISILLTDTNSAWLGLVHGFKSFGIPFRLFTSADSAIAASNILMIYPVISGKAVSKEVLKKIADFLKNGGTVIGVNVLGGLSEEFGIGEALPSRSNFSARINDSLSPLLAAFQDPLEKTISLGNAADFNQTIGTYSYSQPLTSPLLVYENGTACLTQYYYKSGGKAFALGIDPGEFILRSQNERGFNAQRAYVNSYEPSVDVLIRMIKNIYTSCSDDAVFLNTVPGNKSIAVCITHDIDFTRSIVNAVQYAEFEKSQNIPATYFIQTKYVKDWNDDIFFNAKGAECVKKIAAAGMEIASHSVAHSHVFSKFPAGSGTEQYPDYRPRVISRDSAVNGTILGELRVSKFLLEQYSSKQVTSFRSGHLSYPFALPQALEAAGYSYSSCVTANNVLSHLPYQMEYNRESTAELNLFEFPVTIEDEEKPRMDQRISSALQLAKKLGTYGGFMNVLIHTDTLAYKFEFEKRFTDSLRNTAWFGTLGQYGEWWRQRNSLTWRVTGNAIGKTVKLTTAVPAINQSIHVPAGWILQGKQEGISQNGTTVFIQNLKSTVELQFKTSRK